MRWAQPVCKNIVDDRDGRQDPVLMPSLIGQRWNDPDKQALRHGETKQRPQHRQENPLGTS
jgi:hypothetical protein